MVDIFEDKELNQRFNYMMRSTLSVDETLDHIIKNNLSIARFGDGEIRMVTSYKGCAFEGSTYYGTSKLRTVLKESHEKLLVCIAGRNYDDWWKNFWSTEFKDFSNYLAPRIYGNTSVSRSAFRTLGKIGVEKWKKVWEQRDVVFVTGGGSRFDESHTLFENIKSHNTVTSTPTHAIKDIPRLIVELSKFSKDKLLLLALGPAATILAYEMTLLGYQALDIGHITNCYDSCFEGAEAPEKLPLKNN